MHTCILFSGVLFQAAPFSVPLGFLAWNLAFYILECHYIMIVDLSRKASQETGEMRCVRKNESAS